MAMAEIQSHAVANGTSPRVQVAEDETRRAQLHIIARTSRPGAVSAGLGGVLVGAYAAFGSAPEAARVTLAETAACAVVLAGVWAVALRACRRGDLDAAFAAQFVANLISSALFFLFVEDGAVLALTTAFVAVFTGATILGEEQQRVVRWSTTVTVLLAAAGHQLGLVEVIVLPPLVLYSASALGIILVFRTPVAAQRTFDEHLKASRVEALRLAHVANEERDRADAQSRDLAEVSEELRAFTYFVSHDLRAPLINIEGFAKVLEETLEEFDERIRRPGADLQTMLEDWRESHAEVVESLQFIASGTTKLNSLVGGLLELSRLDSRPPQDEEVALTPLLEQIVESLQHQIRERDITVEIGPLPTVVGDPLRLGQVFGNLIDNAIKYMPERTPREIGVSAEREAGDLVFVVSDTGEGIAADKRDAIFRPFHRLDAKKSPAGEGLGLAAVRKIVERCGGRIWVEDGPGGRGARFCFAWGGAGPVHADRPAPAQSAA